MGFQRLHLFKYISFISYVLKSCFTRTKSQEILKTVLHNLQTRILFGSEIPFECVPDNVLEKLVIQCYDDKSILKHSLHIHKCLFVSQETLNKLKLNNMQWVLVNVMTTDPCALPVLHYNKIIVLDAFKESKCLLTSTNFFNLSNCNHTAQSVMLRIVKPLRNYEPKITKKVLISVIKPLVYNDNTQILMDKLLYNYFSMPKFVSVGDILKLDVKKCYPELKYLIQPSNNSVVYLKIIELEGKNEQIHFYNCKSSFNISNLYSKLSEVKCLTNTYLPAEKDCCINNLKNLSINNYKDFILNIFPGGMNDDGELLLSWIKPFIQQKHTGYFFIFFLFLLEF